MYFAPYEKNIDFLFIVNLKYKYLLTFLVILFDKETGLDEIK